MDDLPPSQPHKIKIQSFRKKTSRRVKNSAGSTVPSGQIAVRHGCHESSDATAGQPAGGAVDQSRRRALEGRAKTRGRFMKASGRREASPPDLAALPAARGARSVSSSASFAFATGMQGTLRARQARRPRQGEGAAVALPVWQVSRRMTEVEPLPALTPMRCS